MIEAPLKGTVRRKQVSKTQCLAKECHGDSQEACIALRVRREALWRNVVTPEGIQVLRRESTA